MATSIDTTAACPDHPDAGAEFNFKDTGAYTYCPVCDKVLSEGGPLPGAQADLPSEPAPEPPGPYDVPPHEPAP